VAGGRMALRAVVEVHVRFVGVRVAREPGDERS
jgi:hypothetical protein